MYAHRLITHFSSTCHNFEFKKKKGVLNYSMNVDIVSFNISVKNHHYV